VEQPEALPTTPDTGLLQLNRAGRGQLKGAMIYVLLGFPTGTMDETPDVLYLSNDADGLQPAIDLNWPTYGERLSRYQLLDRGFPVSPSPTPEPPPPPEGKSHAHASHASHASHATSSHATAAKPKK